MQNPANLPLPSKPRSHAAKLATARFFATEAAKAGTKNKHGVDTYATYLSHNCLIKDDVRAAQNFRKGTWDLPRVEHYLFCERPALLEKLMPESHYGSTAEIYRQNWEVFVGWEEHS